MRHTFADQDKETLDELLTKDGSSLDIIDDEIFTKVGLCLSLLRSGKAETTLMDHGLSLL